MGAQNHRRKRLDIINIVFDIPCAQYTSQELALETHGVKGIGNLIVVRLDLS